MEKENSPENFSTWSFGYGGCDDDVYFNDDCAISIWQVLTAPVHLESDARHLSADMRDRLVRHRIAQMEQEGERNIALLQSLGQINGFENEWLAKGERCRIIPCHLPQLGGDAVHLLHCVIP